MTPRRLGLACLLAIGVGGAFPASSPAQFNPGAPPPPPPGSFNPPPTSLNIGNQVGELATRVRHLGEDIQGEIGANAGTPHLLEDTQEMAVAVDEFGQTVNNQPNPFQAAQAFSAIDNNWAHLRGQLTRPGVSTPAVIRSLGRVDEAVAAVRQAVNGNPPPPSYGVIGNPPTGLAETQRLANALVTRAQNLQATIQGNVTTDPGAGPMVAEAIQLANLADQFHDTINVNGTLDVATRAFGPVDACSNRLANYCASGQAAPAVAQAWQSYAQVEGLIQQNLGIGSPQPALPYPVVVQGGGPSPVAGLAQQLFDQTNTYIATFSTTARREPEGLAALSDAQRLLAAVDGFRQAASQGQPTGSLAYAFQDVDVLWQRLARRAARIAKGRNGPYIQQVRAIGDTCDQVHRVLGMIGPTPSLTYPSR